MPTIEISDQEADKLRTLATTLRARGADNPEPILYDPDKPSHYFNGNLVVALADRLPLPIQVGSRVTCDGDGGTVLAIHGYQAWVNWDLDGPSTYSVSSLKVIG